MLCSFKFFLLTLAAFLGSLFASADAEAVSWKTAPDEIFSGAVENAGENGPSAREQCRINGWLNYDTASEYTVAARNTDDLVRSAQRQYPNKAGRIEQHHVTPKYLGGDAKGPLVPLDGAYHQQIANEFRRLHPYGSQKPSPERLQEIMRQVYDKYPLPGG